MDTNREIQRAIEIGRRNFEGLAAGLLESFMDNRLQERKGVRNRFDSSARGEVRWVFLRSASCEGWELNESSQPLRAQGQKGQDGQLTVALPNAGHTLTSAAMTEAGSTAMSQPIHPPPLGIGSLSRKFFN